MSEGLHEADERHDEEAIDRPRAIVSLMDELEAVDWYDQRVALYLEESFSIRVVEPDAAVALVSGPSAGTR